MSRDVTPRPQARRSRMSAGAAARRAVTGRCRTGRCLRRRHTPCRSRCMNREVRRSEALAELWVETADGPIYARVAVHPRGERTVSVVLVHGLVIASRYMVPTAERLAPLCNVYAPDLPGYGKSAKPARVLSLAGLADALARWM